MRYFMSASDWIGKDRRNEFMPEVFETADLCDEVIAELAMQPMERFYLCEILMLSAVMVGHYAKNQTILDWLFDLRRVLGRSLEGGTVMLWRNGQRDCVLYRREVMMPGTVCKL